LESGYQFLLSAVLNERLFLPFPHLLSALLVLAKAILDGLTSFVNKKLHKNGLEDGFRFSEKSHRRGTQLVMPL
jgi:hypothetical protein